MLGMISGLNPELHAFTDRVAMIPIVKLLKFISRSNGFAQKMIKFS